MKILRSSKWVITLMIVTVLVVLGAANVFAAPKQKNIILATTTSTQDTGLLDVLIPIFEKQTGYFVKTIAVGSGQAMAMGQKGEADVMLVPEVLFVKGRFQTDQAGDCIAEGRRTVREALPKIRALLEGN